MTLSDLILGRFVTTHGISLAHLATVGEATWRRARNKVYTISGWAVPWVFEQSGNQTRL